MKFQNVIKNTILKCDHDHDFVINIKFVFFLLHFHQ